MASTVSFAFKAACVSLLVMQNSALALTTRYSRAVLKEQYLTSTTVVLNEVVKLFVSIGMVIVGFRIQRAVKPQDLPRHIVSIIFCREGVLMLVPGLLYFGMNQLAFIGLENLDASTYSLVSQLKILTTAFFARLMLHKQLAWFQWRALTLLVVGVILVQQQPQKPQIIYVNQAPATVPGTPGAPELPEPITPVTPTTTKMTAHSAISAGRLLPVTAAGGSVNIEPSVDVSAGTPNAPTPTLRHLLFRAEPQSTLKYTASASKPELPHHAPQPHTGFNALGSSASTSSSSASSSSHAVVSHAGHAHTQVGTWAHWKGFFAAALAAVLSGLAGCYMEKMMKGGTLTVWDRNIQLAVYGILLGLCQIMLFSSDADRKYASNNGWLGGYSFVAVIVVLLNSLGGILVSLILAYLDNIIRGFATSVAIFITAFVSWSVFHDVELTLIFGCGVITVLISVFNYNDAMIAPAAALAPAAPAVAVASPSTDKSTDAGMASPHAVASAARILTALGSPSGVEMVPRSRGGAQMTPSPRDPDEDEEAALLRADKATTAV